MGGSVYAFAGGKGGVGKTTTTANVAIALAEKGFEVGAVDADLGTTNLGQFLDVESGPGIHDLLAGEVDLADVIVEGPAGVQVVPGGVDPAASANADPSNLRRAVEPLQERVDVVLLDTGAGLSHQNLVAYGLSDAIAVVTTPDSVAVGDADKSADMAARVDSPLVGTVLTRVNGATDMGGLRPSLEREVVAAIPEYDRPDAPEPRVLEAPDSPAAAEYRRLATTVAVCHQTGDVDEAASEANDAVDLPEPPADEGTEPGASEGLLGDLIGRLSLGD